MILSNQELAALLWAVRQVPLEALRTSKYKGPDSSNPLAAVTHKIERELGSRLANELQRS